MDAADQMEVLRGVLAVALADGEITRSEKGVIGGLMRKVGVDSPSLEIMMEQARKGATVKSSMFRPILEDPARAMTLLVGTAAIDGEITEQERSVLVDISLKIGLRPGKFGEVFERGMATARELRKGRVKGN